jgi:hypothetical protein
MQYRLSTLFLIFFVLAASLAAFGLWGLWFGGVLFIAALAINRTKVLYPSGIRICACVLFFGIVCPGLILTLYPFEPVYMAECYGLHLGMIGLGMHNYHDAYKHFPPIIVRDENGKPLYSWMVEMLPMMEYGSIYGQLNKDEPWNSPHNIKILPPIIPEFICPRANRDADDCSSNFVAVIGPGTIWTAEGTKKRGDFPNGSSRIVVAVEVVTSGKHWAEPFALTADELLENTRTGKGIRISSCHPNGVNVLFDFGESMLPTKMSLSLWKRILDGERVGDEELEHVDPNAPDMVDVYVGQTSSTLKKVRWTLSFVVWLFSAALLFHRAAKSRKTPSQTAQAIAGG